MKIRNLPPPDFSRTSFLIVEDFEGMRAILRDILARAGARHIAQANNADSAISMLERTRYDVILCDLHLGHGKNGQDILEEARHRGLLAPHAVWLMVSAEKAAEMVTGTIESRPDDYLIKPITETLLFMRLSQQIAKKHVLAPIEIAMREHEYLKALRLTDSQMEGIQPNTPHAWDLKRLKAELAMASGEHGPARAIYEEALSLRDLPWARLGLAKIHYNEGRLDDARRELKEITDGNRAYLEAHDWLARTLDKLGDHEGAQSVLQRALTTSPRAPLRQLHLGEVAHRRGELGAAALAFQSSIELARNTPLKTTQAYLALSQIHLAQDNPDAALKTLSALSIDMYNNPAARLLAQAMQIPVRLKTGEHGIAKDLAQQLAEELKAKAQHLPPDAVFNLVVPLLALGDKATADALLASVIGNHHDHPEYLERAQAVYTQAGLEDEGRELLNRAARAATDIMNRGVKLSREGKLDEAIQLTREARAQMPSNARLLLNHAFLLIAWMERHGRETALNKEARGCIELARKLKPGEKRASELLTRLELLGSDFEFSV
ncbi:MAG: response regulator [Pseudomonadota bacterium]|nr:response regulator [Pseudomonadota bacterium]